MLRLAFTFTAVILFQELSSTLACPGKLGVSRTITIDTNGGLLHGSVQYKTASLLRDREVVLTFDDGPLKKTTRKVLAALSDHCTRATFFMVGSMAVANPAMVREVASAGHTVASHTWSHKNLKRWSYDRGRAEIELGISTIQHALGKPIAPFFRFPYLADPKEMINYNRQRNIAVFSIDIDSRDFRTRSGSQMRYTVMRHLKLRRKGIILLHDIQISTARGIQSLLDELYIKGYEVVHLKALNTVPTIPVYDHQAIELHAEKRFGPEVRPIELSSTPLPHVSLIEKTNVNQTKTIYKKLNKDWRSRILNGD
ncbi:MAG: hypothetical protein TECD_00497 [Hyphomicrobiaceae bacterium hypho_1]